MTTYSPEMVSFGNEKPFTKIENSHNPKISRSFFEWHSGEVVDNIYDYPSAYTLDSIPVKIGYPWIIIKPNFEPMETKLMQEISWIGLDIRLGNKYRKIRNELDTAIYRWENIVGRP